MPYCTSHICNKIPNILPVPPEVCLVCSACDKTFNILTNLPATPFPYGSFLPLKSLFVFAAELECLVDQRFEILVKRNGTGGGVQVTERPLHRTTVLATHNPCGTAVAGFCLPIKHDVTYIIATYDESYDKH